MTAQSLSHAPRPSTSVGGAVAVTVARNGRSVGRSVLAVLAGLLTTALLSLIVDEILHRARVFPPWGQAYFGAGPYLLAVAYRSIFNVVGFLVTARLAPRDPGRHVAVLAVIGFTLGLLSIVPTVTAKLGPVWYPVALSLMTAPCAYVAVAILRVRARRSAPPSPAV